MGEAYTFTHTLWSQETWKWSWLSFLRSWKSVLTYIHGIGAGENSHSTLPTNAWRRHGVFQTPPLSGLSGRRTWLTPVFREAVLVFSIWFQEAAVGGHGTLLLNDENIFPDELWPRNLQILCGISILISILHGGSKEWFTLGSTHSAIPVRGRGSVLNAVYVSPPCTLRQTATSFRRYKCSTSP